MTPPVIAVVGYSNSGKTRVAAALIRTLTAQGYRIAAVKHCHQGHQVDPAGKDSARLFAAGAACVVASSPGQLTSILRVEADTPLEKIVASLDWRYDLVVAEGFKGSGVPKVLVLGKEPIAPLPQNVVAVVGDRKGVEDAPFYSFQELDRLAEKIKELLLDGHSRHPAVSLVVDDLPVPLNDFPAKALASVVQGFLKALKDVPPNPSSVRIILDTTLVSEGQHTPSALGDYIESLRR